MGTGDGRFVLAAARNDPPALVVGIDADAASMTESARRAARRDALPNALFVVAAAEALPAELRATAELVTVHFPWGSLLRGLVTGDSDVAGQIASVAAPSSRIDVVLSARSSDRLRWLPEMDAGTASRIGDRFAAHGFRAVIVRHATADEVAATRSSWAKRLGAGSAGREVWRVCLERSASGARLPGREALGDTGRP
jgi:16S rRNA (adenine(1408)-N(1))-methyltransferase